jgi:hypothetical protein
MDKELYKELIRVIESYYPITNERQSVIRKVINDKIDNLDNHNSVLKLLCNDLMSVGHVEDFSYLQFPNLKIYIEHIEDEYHFRTYKNFAICISLLCPYYTYFYEYDFRIKTSEGFLRISKICFLKDDKFKFLTKNLDVNQIDSIIKLKFPNYSFVNHQALIENKMEAGLPYGAFDFSETKYSFMEYLFDSTHFDLCFK